MKAKQILKKIENEIMRPEYFSSKFKVIGIVNELKFELIRLNEELKELSELKTCKTCKFSIFIDGFGESKSYCTKLDTNMIYKEFSCKGYKRIDYEFTKKNTRIRKRKSKNEIL